MTSGTRPKFRKELCLALWFLLILPSTGCHPFESVDGNPFGDDTGIEDGVDDAVADQMTDLPDGADIGDFDGVINRQVRILPRGGVVPPGTTVELTADVVGFTDPTYSWVVVGPATVTPQTEEGASLSIDASQASGTVVVDLLVSDAQGEMGATATFEIGVVFHVDPVSGSSENTGLSSTAPVDTLSAAIAGIESMRSESGTSIPAEVRLVGTAEHSLADAIELPSQVVMDGGFDESFSPVDLSARIVGVLSVVGVNDVELRNLTIAGGNSGELDSPLLTISQSGDMTTPGVTLTNVSLKQDSNQASSVLAVEDSLVELEGRLEITMSDNSIGAAGIAAVSESRIQRLNRGGGTMSNATIVIRLEGAASGHEWAGVFLETSQVTVNRIRVEMTQSQNSEALFTGVEATAGSTVESQVIIELTALPLSTLIGVSCTDSSCLLNASEIQLTGGLEALGVISLASELAVVQSSFFEGIDGGTGGCTADVCKAIVAEGEVGEPSYPNPEPVDDAGFSCCTLASFGVVLRQNTVGVVTAGQQATLIEIADGAPRSCLDANVLARPQCSGSVEQNCVTASVLAPDSYLHNNAFHGGSGNGPRTLLMQSGILANNFIETGSGKSGSLAVGLRVTASEGGVMVVNNVFDSAGTEGVPIVSAASRLLSLRHNVFNRSIEVLRLCESCEDLNLVGLLAALAGSDVDNNSSADCLETDGELVGPAADFVDSCVNQGLPGQEPGEPIDCCVLPVTSLDGSLRSESTGTFMGCSPMAVPAESTTDGMEIGPLEAVSQ